MPDFYRKKARPRKICQSDEWEEGSVRETDISKRSIFDMINISRTRLSIAPRY
jgi:hypothetical protein